MVIGLVIIQMVKYFYIIGHGTQVSDNNWVFDRELRKWRKKRMMEEMNV